MSGLNLRLFCEQNPHINLDKCTKTDHFSSPEFNPFLTYLYGSHTSPICNKMQTPPFLYLAQTNRCSYLYMKAEFSLYWV